MFKALGRLAPSRALAWLSRSEPVECYTKSLYSRRAPKRQYSKISEEIQRWTFTPEQLRERRALERQQKEESQQGVITEEELREKRARHPRRIFTEEETRERRANRKYSHEKYEFLDVANLPEDTLEWMAQIQGMSRKERLEFYYDIMGWSLEIPYSREIYDRPKDERLKRRLKAIETIRVVLGYSTNLLRTAHYWKQTLRYRLRKSNMRDVRLICVDTDKVRRLPKILKGEWRRRITSFHLGVAIVDTRDIRDVVNGGIRLPNPSDLIQTYQFAVQGSGPDHDGFLFGETEAISAQDLRARFAQWQDGQDVVVVAYSSRNDLLVLKDFNIMLEDLCRVDMAQATYIPLQTSRAPSLAGLMNMLDMQYAGLHTPGNDAHFTMRAFFGLAALDVIHEFEYLGYGPEKIPEWHSLAVKIARSPFPMKDLDEGTASTSASEAQEDPKD